MYISHTYSQAGSNDDDSDDNDIRDEDHSAAYDSHENILYTKDQLESGHFPSPNHRGRLSKPLVPGPSLLPSFTFYCLTIHCALYVSYFTLVITHRHCSIKTFITTPPTLLSLPRSLPSLPNETDGFIVYISRHTLRPDASQIRRCSTPILVRQTPSPARTHFKALQNIDTSGTSCRACPAYRSSPYAFHRWRWTGITGE